MRYTLFFLLLAFGSALDAEAQPSFSISGSAGYLRLGDFDGPSFSLGGSLVFSLGQDQESGRIVAALWREAAVMSVGNNPDRYFYNSFALSCTDQSTGRSVSKAFCDGEKIVPVSVLGEALYAPAKVGPFSFAFGGGLRYGEEVTRTEYDGVKQRLRPYGTAFVDTSVFSNIRIRLQGRVGSGILQVHTGLLIGLN